jgi:hypothetical protein
LTDNPIGKDGLAPDSVIARYFHVHVKSLPRWDRRPDLDFPRPVYINGRKYRRWEEIREFERRSAVAHASKAENLKQNDRSE